MATIVLSPASKQSKDASGIVVLAEYTMEEVARHKSKADGWLVVDVRFLLSSPSSPCSLPLPPLPNLPIICIIAVYTHVRAG